MGRVVIGMDPHKRSVTIEVMDAEEAVLGGGRFDEQMLTHSLSERRVRWLIALADADGFALRLHHP